MTSTMRFDKWENSLGIGNTQISSSGHLYSPGNVVQVQEYRSTAVEKTVSAGSFIDLFSVTFNVKHSGSKLLIHYTSGQFILSANAANPQIEFYVDGLEVSDFGQTNHIFYGGGTLMRHFLSFPILTNSTFLSGNRNINIKGGCYNTGTATYDYQAVGTPSRRARLLVMEIAQ
jgi:hypothetical protein